MSETTILVAYAILAGTVLAQEDAAETVTLAHRALRSGDTAGQLVKTVSESTISMTVDGESRPARAMKRKRTIRKKSEILSAADGGVSELRVTYMELGTELEMPGHPQGGGSGRRRVTRGGEEMAADDELAGNTYVVDLTGEEPAVTSAEGEPVDDAVARAVLRHEVSNGRYAGWGPPLHEIIPAGEMEVGHRIDLSAEQAAMIVSGRRQRSGAGETGRYSLTLKGTTKVLGAECAVFEVRIEETVTGEGRMGGTRESRMTGQLVAGTGDLWLYKLSLDGSTSTSASFSHGGRTLERSSEATMKLEVTSLYSKAKQGAE